MKTKLLAGAMALALIGCSEKNSESRREAPAYDMAPIDASETVPAQSIPAPVAAPPGAMRSPNIGVSAAPGVAFNYSYAFRLDDNRIAKVQEDHAAACEALGINRCRIAGMTYRLVRENEVEAQLLFKLDPAIARKFGRDALASVEKAEGVLAATRISGEDVGTQISDSQRRSADLNAEIARLETRLKQGGLGDRERAELQQQIAGMRRQLDGERDTRRTDEAMLATTPMQFDYVGTGGLPGIGYGNPFSDALNMLVHSGSVMLSFILVVGAAVLPWALFFALLLMIWRTPPMLVARKWLRGATRPPEASLTAA
ncbi:hypothetical protein ASE06_21590 [Sphingopyxis sp. Root214]|uniref:DUF4349 domain-containing protein n=1 Tax=unclassified Sphingopyxis TaxID=2614943 RepID=UPI0006F6D19F|nr:MULTISPECIES: DUF4349 domain-containing protein [unclassified Sphingopyxis]KQZ71949.1 hypothetical protein ASD73_19255 [Sphingopyxis sp. Root154]KRC05857.1 hypothetical protein ASE06_21590 [Sphingopyxis sp. Root214]